MIVYIPKKHIAIFGGRIESWNRQRSIFTVEGPLIITPLSTNKSSNDWTFGTAPIVILSVDVLRAALAQKVFDRKIIIGKNIVVKKHAGNGIGVEYTLPVILDGVIEGCK